MRSNPSLIVQLENKSEIEKAVNGLFNDEIIIYAGFKCKVHEINIKEEGSKQLGTYQIVASACLLLLEKYEVN